MGSNWANGQVGGVQLSGGNIKGGGSISAAAADSAPCTGIDSQDCDQDTWNVYRRTHELSNGEIIWDMSGNVWERLKDKIDLLDENGSVDAQKKATYPSSDQFIALIPSGGTPFRLLEGNEVQNLTLKEAFGPSGDYATPFAQLPYGTLGLFYTVGDKTGEGLIRGGEHQNGTQFGGLFATIIGRPDAGTRKMGFRCVYKPE